MVMLSQPASEVWLVTAFFVAGVTLGLFDVSWAHALQIHIPREKLARVYAYDAIGSFVAIPFGELVAGPLATNYGTSNVLLVSAMAVIITALGTCLVPEVRKLDNSSQTKS